MVFQDSVRVGAVAGSPADRWRPACLFPLFAVSGRLQPMCGVKVVVL